MWKLGLLSLLTLAGPSGATDLSSAFQRLWLNFWQDWGMETQKLPPTRIPDKKDVFFHGDDSSSLTLQTFDRFVSEYKAVFVNFCSSKSGICHHVAPDWKQFSELTPEIFPRVGVAKVDCVQEPMLCKAKNIKNFPTLRWYSEYQVENYHGVLSTNHFIQITARNMNQTATFLQDNEGMPLVSLH